MSSLSILIFRFLPNTLVIEVDSGAPAEIKCNVDATPLTASTLSWKRPDYKFGKQRKTGSIPVKLV